MVNQSTGNTPFEIVYTCSLRNVYDLTIMLTIAGGSKAVNNVTEKALQIYAEVWAYLEAANANYQVDMNKHRCKKVFQGGDLVIAHLRRSHFPSTHTKLEKLKFGLFRVALKINDNAYML